MNFYDEALESIDKLEISKEYLFQPVLETIIKALETAKKEHELLEMYRMLEEWVEEYNTADSLLRKWRLHDGIRELRFEITALESELCGGDKE